MQLANFDREITFPSLLDSTMLNSSACPRKFFWQYVLRLAPPRKSIHLHAGGAFADALQVVRLAHFKYGKPQELAILDGVRAFWDYWGDYPEPDKSYKDSINVLAAVIDYFRQYPLETDLVRPFIRENGDPAVEFTFAIPLPIAHPDSGEPILYGGRSDMLGVYQSLQCIVDEKTTYSFISDWSKQFQMRGQFIGYCWAGQQSGFEKLRHCIVRGIAIQQRDIKHLEAIFEFPQWQIDRWHSQMLMKVQKLVTAYEIWRDDPNRHDIAWQFNYGEVCSSFGGCEMMDLCATEDPEIWFPTFAQNTWNPLLKDMSKTEEKLRG